MFRNKISQHQQKIDQQHDELRGWNQSTDNSPIKKNIFKINDKKLANTSYSTLTNNNNSIKNKNISVLSNVIIDKNICQHQAHQDNQIKLISIIKQNKPKFNVYYPFRYKKCQLRRTNSELPIAMLIDPKRNPKLRQNISHNQKSLIDTNNLTLIKSSLQQLQEQKEENKKIQKWQGPKKKSTTKLITFNPDNMVIKHKKLDIKQKLKIIHKKSICISHDQIYQKLYRNKENLVSVYEKSYRNRHFLNNYHTLYDQLYDIDKIIRKNQLRTSLVLKRKQATNGIDFIDDHLQSIQK